VICRDEIVRISLFHRDCTSPPIYPYRLTPGESNKSAKATVTGLKPGQKVKVTVNVKPRP
jgi:hypothetical protein